MAWGIVTLVIGLSLTAIAGFSSLRHSTRSDQARLLRQGVRLRASLEGRFHGFEDLLRCARGFAMAQDNLNAAAWADFVDGLDLPHRHPGLKTLALVQEFAPLRKPAPTAIQSHSISHLDETDRFVADGHPLLIVRGHPLPAGSRAIGTDLGQSRHQRNAAERAFASGRPALTGPLVFTNQGLGEGALGMFMALPPKAGQPRTWVSLGLYLTPLIEGLPLGTEEGIGTEIVDLETGKRLGAPLAGPALPELPDLVEEVHLGGRVWQLRSRPLPAFFRARGRELPVLIFLGGTLMSLSISAALWSLATARRRAVLRSRDLTRSFHANLQRYEALVRQTPIGVAEWNPDLELMALNPAGHRMLGLESSRTFANSSLRGRLPAGRRKDLNPLLLEVHKGRQAVQRVIPVELPEGQSRLCEWTCFPILDTEGRVTSLIGLIQDVTERRKEEEARIHQLRLDSLTVLAGGISHDFNNLLSIIQGHAELAAQGGGPALAHHLTPILETTQRAATLAHQMLAFTGRGLHAPERIELGPFLAELKERLQELLPSRVELRVEPDADLPQLVADRSQLTQALTLLVENGAESISDQGWVQIRVWEAFAPTPSGRSAPGLPPPQGRTLCVSVEDSGLGMAPEILDRIFDPFFSTKFAGRGLGLSATLGILKAHGAGLYVDSRPDQGTRFRLCFPLQESGHTLPGLPPTATAAGVRTILFVDDEPMLRDVVQEALEAEGYRVLLAIDGLEAVERFETEHPRIGAVVMDVTMPRMNGLEAFDQMQRINAKVPVILSSGYLEPEFRAGAEFKPTAFLNKPYPLKRLLELLEGVMGPKG